MKNLSSHIMKIVVALAIAVCPASMWAITGDVNGDGSITSTDVTAIYNVLLGTDYQFQATADVDGDGYVTTSDITLVYNILLGNIVIDNEEALFNRCYATLRSEENISVAELEVSHTSLLRSMWQLNTISTDEAYCVWSDYGIPEMDTNQWGSDMPQATGLFYRLCANIDVCNAYLANAATHDDAHNGEIRTLRALYHYYLMDMFGNVPYNTSASIQTIKAAQLPRATVYTKLITELQACENLLVEPRTNTYGRIDKAASWMLIARICLNQNVYSPSTNATYVRNAITLAKTYAKKVLDSSYQLNTSGTSSFNSYQMLFLGDNDTNGAQKEIIWPIPYSDSNDYPDYQWSGSTFLVAACASYNTNYPNGINGQWEGMLARPQFASRFGINNFSTTLTTANTPAQMVAKFGDKRALFFNNSPNPYNAITENMSFSNGVGYLKFLNMKSNGTNPNSTFASTDFPLMRYAEAILTYAEADARLNSGTCSSEALAVLNTLLQRSGVSTLTSANTSTFSDLWSKEFGFEGRRRVDLIRFGKYGSSIANQQNTTLWNWKGGIIGGRAFDNSKNVFAIPTQALQDNSNLTQNDGYDINYGTIQGYMSIGSPYGSNTVTACTMNLTPITSTTHIIYPEYEVRIADNASMDNYQVFDKFVLSDDVTYYNFDLEKVKFYAQQHNTSNLYFQVYSNVSGTGYAYSQVFNVDFHFDLTIRPYWLVGDCVGDGYWTNNSDPYNSSMTPMLPNEDGNFVYAGYFPAGGQFMIISNPGSWTGVVYGGNEYGGQQWSGTGYPDGTNISITQAGYYHLYLDAASHQLTISFLNDQPVYGSMGIIGDFNNWSMDEEMGMISYDYDNHNHDWNATLYLNGGGVKFRADYSWADNWGGSTFPSGISYKNGPNIPVAQGWYKVYFNDITGAYFFTPTTSPYDK